MEQLILVSGSVTDQGTKESSSYLYNTPQMSESIFYPEPSTLSEHLTTTMVDVPPYGT